MAGDLRGFTMGLVVWVISFDLIRWRACQASCFRLWGLVVEVVINKHCFIGQNQVKMPIGIRNY